MTSSESIDESAVSAVAFDMIGVLVREEKLISRGFADFFGSQLLVPLETIKDRYDNGYCPGRISRQAFWDGLISGDWRDAEREFLATRSFAPDASTTLSTLTTRFDLAVISDMPREWAEIILDFHGISPLLQVAVFSNDGRGSKKDGGLFHALVQDLKRPPGQILLVDDRPANLDRARNLGMPGVYLPLQDDDAAPAISHPRVRTLTELPLLLASDER